MPEHHDVLGATRHHGKNSLEDPGGCDVLVVHDVYIYDLYIDFVCHINHGTPVKVIDI